MNMMIDVDTDERFVCVNGASFMLKKPWTAVVFPGYEYFEKFGDVSFVPKVFTEMNSWLVENLEVGAWDSGGVTMFSWRFYFMHEADATAFKLRFGI